MVRECVEEKYLMNPMTVKLLDGKWQIASTLTKF